MWYHFMPSCAPILRSPEAIYDAPAIRPALVRRRSAVRCFGATPGWGSACPPAFTGTSAPLPDSPSVLPAGLAANCYPEAFYPLGVCGDITALALSDANNGWAVMSNTLLRLKDGAWSAVANPASGYWERIKGIALAGPTAGWAVGDASTLMRLSGETWSIIPAGDDLSNIYLSAIDLIDADNGWAVGGSRPASHAAPRLGSSQRIARPLRLPRIIVRIIRACQVASVRILFCCHNRLSGVVGQAWQLKLRLPWRSLRAVLRAAYADWRLTDGGRLGRGGRSPSALTLAAAARKCRRTIPPNAASRHATSASAIL